MDEDMIAFVSLFDDRMLEHSSHAGELADSIESFISTFPDRELRNRGSWMVKRLRQLQTAND